MTDFQQRGSPAAMFASSDLDDFPPLTLTGTSRLTACALPRRTSWRVWSAHSDTQAPKQRQSLDVLSQDICTSDAAGEDVTRWIMIALLANVPFHLAAREARLLEQSIQSQSIVLTTVTSPQYWIISATSLNRCQLAHLSVAHLRARSDF